MALSGTLVHNVGPRWRVQLEWNATQNVSANTSTVTARLYWMGLDQYSAVYASAADAASITVNGSTSAYATATPALSAYQKKLIRTHTVTVAHNSDGSKVFNLSAYFDIYASLSGVWYTRESVSGTATLNTIPRASTSASTPSWTGGNNVTISVNRASSSFSHEADIYVANSAGTMIKLKTINLSSSQTSVSSSFTVAQHTTIFNALNGGHTTASRVVLRTYSGSSLIGSSSRDGTVTAPEPSTVSNDFDKYVITTDTIVADLSRTNSNFTHTVRYEVGSFSKSFTGVGTTVSWTPSAAEELAIGQQMPTDSYTAGRVYVETFYNGVKVRGTTSMFMEFHIRDAEPSFTGAISYADTDSSMTAITGNNQYIIQGKSNLVVTLPSTAEATARKGASLVSFVASVAGESITIPFASGTHTFNFGTINGSTNQTAVVEVVDSRGNRGMISKIVSIVPYTAPTLNPAASRVNGFEQTTMVNLEATYHPLMVGGVSKNYLSLKRYRVRLKNGAWGSYTGFAGSTSNYKFVSTATSVQLEITSSYEIEFNVTDRLGGTTSIRTVGVGRPIFFIDDILGSIGMNDFPKDPNTFLLNGRLTFAGNLYASSGEGSVGGAIDLNNGDIVRANGIFFNDTSNNSGEGLLFPRTGTPAGSTNAGLYDNFYVLDGKMFLNHVDFIEVEYGSGAGSGIRIGAGGQTIIGAGESSTYVKNGAGETNAVEQMHVASDNDITLWAGAGSGLAGANKFVFQGDGILRRDVYKEGNGYQTVTLRDEVNHDDPMLIQTNFHSLTFSNSTLASLDITWGTAFDTTPVMVLATPTNANSLNFSVGIYSVTQYGCRVYLKDVREATGSSTIDIRVMSIGRRA